MVGASKVHSEDCRHFALSYVWLSYARDEAVLNSADRQRANVLALCEQHGWTPIWFEDRKTIAQPTRRNTAQNGCD